MKYIVRILCMCAMLSRPAAALAQDYVPGIEDVPLMQGLHVVDGEGMVFDAPEGRVVEIYAQGTVPVADIIGFYQQNLPQLGWRQRSHLNFVRQNETLTLELDQQEGESIIRFALSPKAD